MFQQTRFFICCRESVVIVNIRGYGILSAQAKYMAALMAISDLGTETVIPGEPMGETVI